MCKFHGDFTKSHNKDNDIGYLFEVNVKYFKQLHKLQNDLPFLPKGTKSKSMKTGV